MRASRAWGSYMAGPASLVAAYRDQIARGELQGDPAQFAAVEKLGALAGELQARAAEATPKLLARLVPRRNRQLKGLYLHGDVGRGKTMLMDLFFEHVAGVDKRRLHFHEFMAETHERIARGRATTDGDPIPFVAAEIAAAAPLICFDELHVTDIADAMILGRLFKSLFEKQVTVVATSNAAPEKLYWNGLNRQLFLPFIDLLQDHMEVFELAAAKDYRLEKLAGRPLYFSPLGTAATAALDDHWRRLTGGHSAEQRTLEVKGRHLTVPASAMGVARFSFDDLCTKPLGALDYLHLAHAFHTLMIDEIPILTPDKRNEARRFITLIDTLYDNRVSLIASAAAEPEALYPAGDGADLFLRTASRLQEMRSEAYLAKQSSGSSVPTKA
jgi:cell division protein ZapE